MSIAPPCHTRNEKTTDDWITPKWLIDRIGPFDIDVCESRTQPWRTALIGFTEDVNGLSANWADSFVYCNPPYGSKTELWLGRMALHGHGIALVFARTETRMFFRHVWPHASALLFLKGRLTFAMPDGTMSKAGHNSGGPSVLIAYGQVAAQRLFDARDLGAFVRLEEKT